jgi:hypothetical protein
MTDWQEQTRLREEEWKKQEEAWKRKNRRWSRIFYIAIGCMLLLSLSPMIWLLMDSGGPEVTAEAIVLSRTYGASEAAWNCQIQTPDGNTTIWMPLGFESNRIRVIYNKGNYSGSPYSVRLAPPE